MISKDSLRREIKACRNSLTEEEIKTMSQAICDKFISLYADANVYGIYAPIGSEVLTDHLISLLRKKGKTIALPVAYEDRIEFKIWPNGQELIKGKFCSEPEHSNPSTVPDIVAVPVLGFDSDFNRLGYGRGYYDKYFASNPSIVKIGLAFFCQEVPSIPCEYWDQKLDFVITERFDNQELFFKNKHPISQMKLDQFMSFVIPYYYQNNMAIGSVGDFLTAPEISQMFGEMVGIWCAEKFLQANSPKFQIIELGAGNGTMLSDLLRATKHVVGFHENLENIVVIENSDLLKSRQKLKLKQYDKCKWKNNLDDIDKLFTIIIANEFFDALPIKQYQVVKSRLHEVMIKIANNKAEFVLSSEGLSLDLFGKYGSFHEGDIIETSPASLNYAHLIKNLITQNGGAALIIDYGYVKSTNKSTLQALYEHRYISPLEKIGNADITAHVNFQSLAEVFAGCNDIKISTQSDFLTSYGITTRAEQLINKASNKSEEIKSQLERLISSQQMGELFKVLEASY